MVEAHVYQKAWVDTVVAGYRPVRVSVVMCSTCTSIHCMSYIVTLFLCSQRPLSMNATVEGDSVQVRPQAVTMNLRLGVLIVCVITCMCTMHSCVLKPYTV